MDKRIIDCLAGDLNFLEWVKFKFTLICNREVRNRYKEYRRIWKELDEWKVKVEVPEMTYVINKVPVLQLKPSILLIIGMAGLGIGFFAGLNSYISASDYMNYAVEVIYEE